MPGGAGLCVILDAYRSVTVKGGEAVAQYFIMVIAFGIIGFLLIWKRLYVFILSFCIGMAVFILAFCIGLAASTLVIR